MNKTCTFILATCISASTYASVMTDVTDSLDFEKGFATNPAMLLRGQYSGVRVSSLDGNINGVTNVNIRGINTLRGDSQPLWIVDGVIVDLSSNQYLDAFWQLGEGGYASGLNPLAYLNPYDIEKIEVLKDLSSAALYGARGANGVILITTKKAKSEDKLDIDWNSNIGVSTPTFTNENLQSGFNHNHHLSVSGITAKTNYRVSAFYRGNKGITPNAGNNYGGVRFSLDAVANPVVQFGMSTALVMGKTSNTAGTAWLGASSFTTALRGITNVDECSGWKKDYDDDSNEWRVNASAYLNVNIAPWFFWKTDLGVDYYSQARYFWMGNGTAFGHSKNGVASILGYSSLNDNLTTKFVFKRNFSIDHRFTASIGGAQYFSSRKSNVMEGCDFFSHELRAKGLNLSAMTEKQIRRFQPDFSQFAAFATVSYDYKGLVGADASMRAEFTPKYTDGKPVLYPAVNAFLDIHELFMPSLKAVSTLRLEAGFGKAGRDEYKPIFSSPYVLPETEAFYDAFCNLISKEFHVGIKFGAISDRILVGLSYYDKSSVDTYDLYCFGKNKPNASKAGGLFMWDYDERYLAQSWKSEIANKGLEFDLKADIIRKQNVQWSVSANLSYNSNSLLSVAEDDVAAPCVTGDIFMNSNIAGNQLGAIYGLNEATGKHEVIGNPIPKFNGGLSSLLRIKDFTVDAAFDGAFGHQMLNLNKLVEEQSYPYYASSKFVEKADYFRLSRLSLAYDIPFKNLKWIKSVRVNVSEWNLFTVSSYSGYNPDVNSYGLSTSSAGLDYGSYPIARTFILGFSFKF